MEMTSTEYDHAQDELQSYRSVSLVCVLALVGGLLSVVALAHPILWLVPFIFLTLGFWGFRQVTKKSDQYIGKTAALIGICVSMFFLSLSVSKYYSERWLVSHHARQFAQEWLESLVGNQHEKAHQGWLEYYYRQPDGTDLSDYYTQNVADKEDLDKFLALEEVRDLCQLSENASVEFVRTDAIYESVEGHSVYLIFKVEDGSAAAVEVVLRIKRTPYDNNVYWAVNEIHKVKT